MLRFFWKHKITTTKKTTNLPQRASLRICEISVLWGTQLKPTCLDTRSDVGSAAPRSENNLREFCALEHSTQTHLPQRASLKICDNSVLWSAQLRSTCLKQLLGYFASSVLWSTFVQTHLPQKTEHEGAKAGSAKRKQLN